MVLVVFADYTNCYVLWGSGWWDATSLLWWEEEKSSTPSPSSQIFFLWTFILYIISWWFNYFFWLSWFSSYLVPFLSYFYPILQSYTSLKFWRISNNELPTSRQRSLHWIKWSISDKVFYLHTLHSELEPKPLANQYLASQDLLWVILIYLFIYLFIGSPKHSKLSLFDGDR